MILIRQASLVDSMLHLLQKYPYKYLHMYALKLEEENPQIKLHWSTQTPY